MSSSGGLNFAWHTSVFPLVTIQNGSFCPAAKTQAEPVYPSFSAFPVLKFTASLPLLRQHVVWIEGPFSLSFIKVENAAGWMLLFGLVRWIEEI
jgi:hypothetical protein